ncbi:MAG: CoA transferase [Chloroflexi bacterium]|nr:CoA transferase [Chloroflexota bacterium]
MSESADQRRSGEVGAAQQTGGTAPRRGPLAGVRVLELGSLIAGPFCGRILADFGAEVLKIEPPGAGDPLRTWSLVTEHGSLWAMTQSRNKESVTVDLRTAEGREIVCGLALESQVVIENFRPGRMEEWGLGWEQLAQENPALVMVRISGFGQTGPYSHRPGFGNIAESMGGIRYITGWPDRPPMRVGLSIGDSIAALYAVIGTMMALREAERTGHGQVVDVALSESVFSMLEAIVPEYGYDGRVRERTGNLLGGAAPTNMYPTADERWLAIGANGDGIFKRFTAAIGQPELAHDPRFSSNQARRANVEMLDQLIAEWTRGRTLDDAMVVLDAADVPAGPVYSVKDIAEDPQYQAREMLVDLPDPRLGHLLMPGVVPKLSRTPGEVRAAGPELGAQTLSVLGSLLGLDAEQLADLQGRKVI